MIIKAPKFAKPVNAVIDDLCSQIESWVKNANKDGCVVGISGGVDSAVVASLCDKATKFNGLTTHGLFIDAGNSETSYHYYTLLTENLGIERKYFSIIEIINLINSDLDLNKYDRGNLASELRAVILSRYAAKHNLLVMGTGNYDEDTVLGYFTKRGDGAVDNNVLGNIPKNLVYLLAQVLDVPKQIITRKPTAELWEGQTDEEELGFDYETANKVYYFYTKYSKNVRDLEKTHEEISRYDGMPSLGIINKIIGMHNKNKHKSELPPSGEVEIVYE